MQAQYHAIKDRAEVRAKASASIGNLQLAEAGSGERLLQWSSVAASGIDFSLARSPGDRGHRRARAKHEVLVNKDRSTNIGQAMKPPGAAKPPADPPTAGETKTSEFPVSIERVNVEKASVDFSDLSLVLPLRPRSRTSAAPWRD